MHQGVSWQKKKCGVQAEAYLCGHRFDVAADKTCEG
jgi:hypothetical protein